MTPRSLFRLFAVAETITWALLLTAMFLKYAMGVGDWPVSIAGPIHGFVFIAFVLVAAVVAVNQRWRLGALAVAVLSAVVPFATVPVEVVFDRRGLLSGPWRRQAGLDASIPSLADRILGASLRRPAMTVTLLAVAAAGAFAALLIVGPPGGSEA